MDGRLFVALTKYPVPWEGVNAEESILFGAEPQHVRYPKGGTAEKSEAVLRL